MTVTEESEEFMRLHQHHGPLVGDADAPTLTGYLLTIKCQCGVTFVRHVAAGEAALDLAIFASRNVRPR